MVAQPVSIPSTVDQRVRSLYYIMQSVESNLGGGEGLEGIYGTLTRHYMQLVLESLSAHCGLVASSSLIDVGSGLGRPLMHACVSHGLTACHGIEIDFIKCAKANAFVALSAQRLKSKLAGPAITLPSIQCCAIEEVPELTASHVFSFWEGIPTEARCALGRLVAASPAVQGVAVCQRAMRGGHPEQVMEEMGFRQLKLVETFPVSMAGRGQRFVAYIFVRPVCAARDGENVQEAASPAAASRAAAADTAVGSPPTPPLALLSLRSPIRSPKRKSHEESSRAQVHGSPPKKPARQLAAGASQTQAAHKQPSAGGPPPANVPLCSDAFRLNVRKFLKVFARKVDVLPTRVFNCWVLDAPGPRGLQRVYVYEEKATEATFITCDQCRIIGWQHHPVSSRRYHFVVPAISGATSPKGPMSLPYMIEAKIRGQHVEAPASFRALDAPDVPYTAPASITDSSCHLLHGVLHANGFGHLVRVNGLEGGSDALTGRQLMDLWDRLCCILRARTVSVEDVSNKGGMELRVLHTAAHQQTWYGQWGYKFGRAGFNLSATAYHRSLSMVHRAETQRMRGKPSTAGTSLLAGVLPAARPSKRRREKLEGPSSAPEEPRRTENGAEQPQGRSRRGRLEAAHDSHAGKSSSGPAQPRFRPETRGSKESAAEQKQKAAGVPQLAPATKKQKGSGPTKGSEGQNQKSPNKEQLGQRTPRARASSEVQPVADGAPQKQQDERETPDAKRQRLASPPIEQATAPGAASRKSMGGSHGQGRPIELPADALPLPMEHPESMIHPSCQGVRWTQSQLDTQLKTIMSGIQDLDGSSWVSKVRLQEVIRKAGLRDNGLMDHLLKSVRNSIADGHVLYRQLHPVLRANYYKRLPWPLKLDELQQEPSLTHLHHATMRSGTVQELHALPKGNLQGSCAEAGARSEALNPDAGPCINVDEDVAAMSKPASPCEGLQCFPQPPPLQSSPPRHERSPEGLPAADAPSGKPDDVHAGADAFQRNPAILPDEGSKADASGDIAPSSLQSGNQVVLPAPDPDQQASLAALEGLEPQAQAAQLAAAQPTAGQAATFGNSEAAKDSQNPDMALCETAALPDSGRQPQVAAEPAAGSAAANEGTPVRVALQSRSEASPEPLPASACPRLISPADARQPPQQLPPVLAAEDAASAPLPASALSGPVTDRPAEAGPVSKRKLGASPAKKPRLSIGAGSSGKGKGKAKHGLARELQELLRAGGEAHAGRKMGATAAAAEPLPDTPQLRYKETPADLHHQAAAEQPAGDVGSSAPGRLRARRPVDYCEDQRTAVPGRARPGLSSKALQRSQYANAAVLPAAAQPTAGPEPPKVGWRLLEPAAVFPPQDPPEGPLSKGRGRTLDLAVYTAAVQALRDAKHFMKDYGGELRPDKLHPSCCPGTIQAPDPACAHKAAEAALRDVYRMLDKWQVERMDGLKESTELRGRVAPSAAGAIISVHGSNVDPNPCWRHAGGAEDWADVQTEPVAVYYSS
ncbi:hypothetical protein WJX84_008430 [Apatococcus fuscideae]|uniref:PTC1-like winged helix-turn-helix domain-containing protein n=1 Tax=Apatococcus fuscideae TaxID=2026836 RepID=A0AAW1TDL3_9CHLO